MILIDMELPVGCEVCPLCDFDKHSDKCICKITGYDAEESATGAVFGYRPSYCPMMECDCEKPDKTDGTRFELFKSCKEPEDMVMLLNGNERLFCPRGYADNKKNKSDYAAP